MRFFFDRSVGITIPRILKNQLKPADMEIDYHQEHFPQAEQDEVWLPIVASWGCLVIGHDHSYHVNSPEVDAILKHSMGAFYLWGTEAPKWEVMQCLAKGYDNILKKATSTPRPFVYKVHKHGGLAEIYLPPTQIGLGLP